MSITGNADIYSGVVASINANNITGPLAQANYVADYLRVHFDNKDGYAYGTMGRTGSVMLNMLDSDKSGFVRQFNQNRLVNTYYDPQIEYAVGDADAKKISKSRNVNTTTEIGQNNISYRSNLDLASDVPNPDDNFVQTLSIPMHTKTVGRIIQQAELSNNDIQGIFNIVAREYESIEVEYARSSDRFLLQAVISQYDVVNGLNFMKNGSQIGIDFVSNSSRIKNSRFKTALWDDTFETSLISSHAGLNAAGLRRLSKTMNNFEIKGARYTLLLPDHYITPFLEDAALMNQYGFQSVAEAILDGKIYVPNSDGLMYYRMKQLPFDIIGFNDYYQEQFYVTGTGGNPDYVQGILIHPQTFETAFFNDPVTKITGQMIAEKRLPTTTSLLEDLYIRRETQLEVLLKNPFLSKKIKLGVIA